MEFITYLFKVNIAIVLLYGFYRLILQRDTFFQWKRLILLMIFLISALYPFWSISQNYFENKAFDQMVENGTIFPSYYLNEIVVTPNTTAGNSFSLMNHLPQLLTGIYVLGAIVILLWILFQTVSTFFMIYKTKPIIFSDRKIYVKKGIKTPFSFFNWIVLDPDLYTDKELQEILQHETTHVNQKHSVDMILSELMCAFCWFNPFVWLMKQEIRMNLEYLADRSVVESGNDAEHYQLHLLRLAYHKAAATITNNFNVSPLKKRIFMMNKKETSLLGLAKYALFLPLIAALMLFNTLDVLSSAKETLEMQAVTGISPEEAEAISEPLTLETQVIPEEPAVQQKKTSQENVFSHVEEPPQFPGGQTALMKWLQENVQYPADAANAGIQGRVTVRFIVYSTGKVGSVEVIKPLNPILDKEAVRVVYSMPEWIPGKQNGKEVDVYFTLPVQFRLDKKDSEKKTETSEKKETETSVTGEAIGTELEEISVTAYDPN